MDVKNWKRTKELIPFCFLFFMESLLFPNVLSEFFVQTENSLHKTEHFNCSPDSLPVFVLII